MRAVAWRSMRQHEMAPRCVGLSRRSAFFMDAVGLRGPLRASVHVVYSLNDAAILQISYSENLLIE